MTAKHLKRPRDPVELGKLIGDIGQIDDIAAPDPKDKGKNPAAIELGRKGGLKGGAPGLIRSHQPNARA